MSASTPELPATMMASLAQVIAPREVWTPVTRPSSRSIPVTSHCWMMSTPMSEAARA
jgi:hypothetical protein